MTESNEPNPESRIELATKVFVPRGALRYQFARSQGPGGQNVNKVNSKAELRVFVTAIAGLDEAGFERLRRLAGSRLTKEDEILIAADESRSQVTNKRRCLERLRELVTEAAKRPKTRRKKRPTRGMIERRLQGKREQGEKKSRRTWRRGGGDSGGE